MIQNVKTRWNSIYYMLKKVFLLRNVIQIWLDDQSRMQMLKIKNVKWDQISFILDMLKSFQKITKTLKSSNQLSIHKAWIVYNALHQHLKRYEKDLIKNARDSSFNLRLTVQTAQKKLTKYYETIFEAEDLYFNLNICLNSCDKLNYYSVSSISSIMSRDAT
jgi:ribosomal protein S15P/S13E